MDKVEDTQTHYRTCNICEASCGLVIQHQNGRIVSIKGDALDPLSEGHICPKAVALQDLQEDPDRLRKPLKKTADGWQEIEWQQAFDEIASNLQRIQDQYSKDAVGLYVGNPTAHNHGALLMLAPFIAALDTRSRFSATSCDQLPHMLACKEMFGHFANFPIPDLDRTDYFLCLGANPLASNGSVMTAPNIKSRLQRLQQRGGRFVVLDPRRTESAEIASEHQFIKPGTDALLLLALLNVIFTEGLHSEGAARGQLKNLQELQQAVQPFSPAQVAPITGIAAADIQRLAREFAAAPRAIAYGRVGVSTSQFSSINAWLIYALNIVTGNLDKAGGLMFTLPAIDLVGLSAALGETGSFDRWRSRVRNLPEFAGEIPVATMAEEILTPGAGQIKAMITHAGNPVLSVPNGKLLEQAFEQLEYMVSIDIYLNETTKHADIILPPTGPLEHGHYELGLHGVAIRNTVKYSPPLLTPPEGALHDWQILAELTARLESTSALKKIGARTKLAFIRRLTDEGLLDWLLRLGPYGKGLPLQFLRQFIRNGLHSFAQGRRGLSAALQSSAYGSLAEHCPLPFPPLDLQVVKEHPHGIDLGPLQPMLSHRIFTRDGLIDLAPELFVQDLKRLQANLPEAGPEEELLLIGRRHVRSNNSWMHNSSRLIKGKNRCNLMMASADAARRGLQDGEWVSVQSGTGTVTLPLWVSDDIMPGVVSMPHGWGHHRAGTALAKAATRAGVSMNDITDHNLVDGLTGMAVINGVPVQVNACAEQPVHHSQTAAVSH
ncbi:MAG: molybdopterin oxidoreductase family protein [Pseudomonadota bacterium]|nr:molybdopterin oxidoreductase family protein [Pseudomonadota bacterium]